MKIGLKKEVNVQFHVWRILKREYRNPRYFPTYIIFFLKLRIYILQPEAEFLTRCQKSCKIKSLLFLIFAQNSR